MGGERVKYREEIEATLNNFFPEIMLDPRLETSIDIDQITRFIPYLFSSEKNYLLMKPITLYEVEEAVFQMREGTAPGPNGFTVNFFHHYWDLIKMEVYKIVEYSRTTKKLLP